jgi:hypothetical protein
LWFSADPNHFYKRRHPAPHEGRFAIVTDAGWDAMDAAASGVQLGSQGGLLSVSDVRHVSTNGADADGEGVWSWHPLLVSSWRRFCWLNRVGQNRQSANDGGKRNSRTGESTK